MGNSENLAEKTSKFKKLTVDISAFFGNKYAALLLLLASFFVMLSFKMVPAIYTLERNFNLNSYELFPLSWFDYLIWGIVFIGLMLIINSVTEHIHIKFFNRKLSYKSFVGLAILFFLTWLPYFFTFFPGTIFYDELHSMKHPYETSNQSLLYGHILNFFWNIGIWAGDETFGFAILTVLRMMIMAGSLSYLICFLYEHGINKAFLFLNVLVFAFFPIFPNNAITLQKDGLNACIILLLTLFIYKYKDNISAIFNERKNLLIFFLLSVLVVQFRSNGVHVLLVMLFVCWYLEKQIRLKISLYILLILAIAIIPNRGRHTPFEETVGVPLQQIGRTVYNNGYIDKDEKIILQKVMDFEKWKERYVCWTVDFTKWNHNFNSAYLKGHKAEFLWAWARTFLHNPSIYFTAHAFNTYDFWAVAPWMIWGNQTVYTGVITKENLNEKKFSNLDLQSTSDILFNQSTSDKIRIFMKEHVVYLNAGTCAFIMLFMMALTLQMGKKRQILSVLPAFLSWLTIIIASPIGIAFRYVLYLAFLMPFIISLPFMVDEEKTTEDCYEQ